MESVEILYWGLSSLFSLAMAFAILVWCRSWRKEERQERDRQMEALEASVSRLLGALDLIDHSTASIQTADEHLTRHLDQLKEVVQSVSAHESPPPATPTQSVQSTVSADEPEPDVYHQAKSLIRSGSTPEQVARELDLGVAEVQMIARVLHQEATA